MQNQRKIGMRMLCVLLMLLTVFSAVAVTVSAVVSSDSGVYYKVVGQSAGSFYYYGYDYVNKTSVTSGGGIEFSFTGGFTVEYAGNVYYAACASAGIARPDSQTTSNGLLKLQDPHIDERNNSAKYGYMFTGEHNNERRTIDLDFIFACWYYAYQRFPNGYIPTAGQAITWDNCLMQEAVSIAYRYQWDTRVISKKIYPDTVVNSRAEYDAIASNPNLTRVTGDYYTLMYPITNILEDALVDAEGIWKNNKVSYTSDRLTAYYNGYTLQLLDTNYTTNSKTTQNLFLFRPNSGTTQPGSLRVQKTDATTGAALPGARFDLYKETPAGSGSYVNMGMNLETNSSGIAQWWNLDPGNYYVVETAAPDGYKLDSTKHYVTVTANSSTPVTVTVPNEAYKIRVQKVDEDGKVLPGATFALYKKESGTYRLFGTQKATTGLATWDGLEPADYYVVETAAPPGYELDTTKHYITQEDLKADGTVTIQIKNKQTTVTGSWTPNVVKLLEGDDLKSGQFTFQLWESNGNNYSKDTLLQTVVNNPDGTIPFKAVNYNEIGVHYYVICEVAGSDASISYDSRDLQFQVWVRSGDGELRITEYMLVDRTINNKKKGAVSVKKVDEDGNPIAGVKFELWRDPDCEWEYEGSMTTGDDGMATYGVNSKGEYTRSPGQKYWVKEVSCPAGYVMDTTIYPVTIVAGEMVYVNGGVVVNPSINGSWYPNVFKIMEGRELKAGEFTFVLMENGKVLQTVKNDENGYIDFTPITYRLSDVGTHKYTIQELDGTDGSVAYDEHVVTFTVEVSYPGTGTALTVKQEVSGDTTFRNYVPTGSWTPKVSKVMEGRELKEEEFTFVLEEDGVEIQRVTNNADGSVVFAEIQYALKDAKTYTYTVHEVTGSDNGISYDSHTVTFTVTVSYPGTGTALTVAEDVDGDATFRNKLSYGAIGVKKVDDKGEPLAGVTFGIYLDNGAVDIIATMTTGEDGIATYGVNSDGGYTLRDGQLYYVQELSSTYGYARDTAIYPVTVVVGTLTYINDGNPIVNMPVSASWQPELKKEVINRELGGVQFTFILEEDGVEIQRAKNYLDGSIVFSAIEYGIDDVGRHVYTVYELNDGMAGYVYDEHTVTYIVNVSYNGGDELTVEEEIIGNTTFKNTYVAGSVVWTPKIWKQLTGAKLKDGMFYFRMGYPSDETKEDELVTNDAEGCVVFPPITYTQEDVGKSFTYAFFETGCTELVDFDYTQIDPAQEGLFIVVTVTDPGTGQLELRFRVNWASPPPDFDNPWPFNYTEEQLNELLASGHVFNNCVVGKYAPTVRKNYNGKLKGGEFTFALTVDGMELERATNNADGSVVFEGIEFRLYSFVKAGALLWPDWNIPYDVSSTFHTLTIREIPGDDPDVEYDPTVYTFTVEFRVSDDDIEVIVTPEPDGGVFTFTNMLQLQPGRIEITKTDPYGNKLAGAEFLLEWSEDGNEWFPVTAATELVAGGCSSAGLKDGKLITDEEGWAAFEGLHPDLYYRLTETKAPEGMQLQADYAFEGLLSDHEDMSVSLQVVNAPIFTIPDTGDHGFGYLLLAVPMLCCMAGAILLAGTNKKRKV